MQKLITCMLTIVLCLTSLIACNKESDIVVEDIEIKEEIVTEDTTDKLNLNYNNFIVDSTEEVVGLKIDLEDDVYKNVTISLPMSYEHTVYERYPDGIGEYYKVISSAEDLNLVNGAENINSVKHIDGRLITLNFKLTDWFELDSVFTEWGGLRTTYKGKEVKYINAIDAIELDDSLMVLIKLTDKTAVYIDYMNHMLSGVTDKEQIVKQLCDLVTWEDNEEYEDELVKENLYSDKEKLKDVPIYTGEKELTGKLTIKVPQSSYVHLDGKWKSTNKENLSTEDLETLRVFSFKEKNIYGDGALYVYGIHLDKSGADVLESYNTTLANEVSTESGLFHYTRLQLNDNYVLRVSKQVSKSSAIMVEYYDSKLQNMNIKQLEMLSEDILSSVHLDEESLPDVIGSSSSVDSYDLFKTEEQVQTTTLLNTQTHGVWLNIPGSIKVNALNEFGKESIVTMDSVVQDNLTLQDNINVYIDSDKNPDIVVELRKQNIGVLKLSEFPYGWSDSYSHNGITVDWFVLDKYKHDPNLKIYVHLPDSTYIGIYYHNRDVISVSNKQEIVDALLNMVQVEKR